MKKKAVTAFTFVEVMLALAVISISLLSLLKLHLTAANIARRAEMTAQAVLLAQEKMAETLAVAYPKIGQGSGTVERNSMELTWRTEVANLQSAPLENVETEGLRQVSVEVTWQQAGGLKRLRMSTYVARRNQQ